MNSSLIVLKEEYKNPPYRSGGFFAIEIPNKPEKTP